MSPATQEAVVVRPARLGDVDAMLEIKGALRLNSTDNPAIGRKSPRGGFLLGASRARYELQVSRGIAWMLEVDGLPVGFTTALPDPLLRASDLWQRQVEIAWHRDFSPLEISASPVAYFDQIAVLPGARRRFYGAALGLRTLASLFIDHRHVLTTTVARPLVNRAAHAFIDRVGGRQVGTIDETYPEIGPITSTLHYISEEAFAAAKDRALQHPHPALAAILRLGLGLDLGPTELA